MSVSHELNERVIAELTLLYGERAADSLERLLALCRQHAPHLPRQTGPLWSERDAVLITYGDQIRGDDVTPLAALGAFLRDESLTVLFSTVHLLPFFPWSSDDGFSVIDYRQVDPALGDWDDVEELRRSAQLMFDLVLNHCSAESDWFQKYRDGIPPFDEFFIEADPNADLSAVTRPRSLPLLTPVETKRGTRHVWTTFSADQVDLNFANPDVLLEMIDVLLGYAARGARIVRLDAIAYLWKEIGTPCIHHPQTHAVVRLMRAVLDEFAPGTILLTETNVPHDENVSYFGDGDEAHMVYNFSLAPLLLDAFLSADARPLNEWLAGLEPAGPGTAHFNFTASHDGVGVRPLEGLLEPARFERLVEDVRRRGGRVSTKRNADGSDSPYELNVAYFSALGPPAGDPAALPLELHVRRFLSSQALMLALRGIPGVYFHSLVGTENDCAGMQETGRARTINRRKFHRRELDERLHDSSTAQRMVFEGYRKLLAVRARQPAFHPDAPQAHVETAEPSVIAFVRTSLDNSQRILSLTNVAGSAVEVDAAACAGTPSGIDLLGGAGIKNARVVLAPFATAWIELNQRR